MKVSDLKDIVPLQAAATNAPAVRQKEDKVSLERTKELEATIARAKAMAGGGRAAQIEAIAAQVRAGTFKPSAQQIADRLLSAAEIDAKLRSLLG